MSTDPTLEPILIAYQHFLQFQKQGDLLNAQGAMYEAIRRTRRLERPPLQAALLLKLGRFYLDALGNLQSAAHAFAAGGNLLLEDSKFRAEMEKAIAPLEKQEKQYMGSKDSLPDNYRPETEEDLLLAEEDPLLAVQLLVEGGNCLLELGQDQLALGMFEGALGVSALKADEVWQAKVLTNVGETHRRLDHLALAETFLTQAQNLFEKTGNQADTKEFLAAFATLRCDQERWEEAARLYEQAVDLYRKAEDDQGHSRTLVRLAKLYLDQQEFAKARPHLTEALELSKPSGDKSNLVFVLENLARCYLGEGQARAAIPYLEDCFQTLRNLVEDVIQTEQGKISRIAGMQWSLNALIECYLEQLRDPDRPEHLEVLILEKIDALHGLILDKMIAGTIKPYQNKERIELPASPGLGNQIMARGVAMADFTGSTEKAMDHPLREKASPLVRLVYHLTDKHLVVVCDRPGEAPVVISRLQSREKVQQDVAQLIRSLKVNLSSREVRGIRLEALGNPADSAVLLQAWYQLLIQPVAALLPKQESILVIEPHDALHLVPFGALMPRPEEYLADQYAVLISPSQETLETLRSYQPYHADLPSARVLIVGNPQMEAKIEVDGETYSQFADLPGAAAEAALLQALFDRGKVTYLTDAAAEEPAIREAARESNILHLATHGLAFTDRPMSSLLVVAGGKGYVTARTIRDWAMPADLVVLSACQTALGRLAETEGVIGLSRALFIAGARTVVVSLWSVSDAATALLMEYFYGALLAGKTVPEAMRTAQMKLKNRREYAHPFYWAGFVVIGAEA